MTHVLDAEVVSLTLERGVLEVYRTVISALEGLAGALHGKTAQDGLHHRLARTSLDEAGDDFQQDRSGDVIDDVSTADAPGGRLLLVLVWHFWLLGGFCVFLLISLQISMSGGVPLWPAPITT